MSETITITKEQLKIALSQWEESVRKKKPDALKKKDYRKLPVDQMGEVAADYFWPILVDVIGGEKSTQL